MSQFDMEICHNLNNILMWVRYEYNLKVSFDKPGNKTRSNQIEIIIIGLSTRYQTIVQIAWQFVCFEQKNESTFRK